MINSIRLNITIKVLWKAYLLLDRLEHKDAEKIMDVIILLNRIRG